MGAQIFGYFKNGSCNKYGKKVLANGCVYMGDMQFDQPHGRGICCIIYICIYIYIYIGLLQKTSGKVKVGKWEKGAFVKSVDDYKTSTNTIENKTDLGIIVYIYIYIRLSYIGS